MQHLKVSGAVRPLKWSLGVKWLKKVKLDKTGSGRSKMARSYLFGNAAWCPIKGGKFPHLLSDYKVSYKDSAVGTELVSRNAYHEYSTSILRTLARRMELAVTN